MVAPRPTLIAFAAAALLIAQPIAAQTATGEHAVQPPAASEADAAQEATPLPTAAERLKLRDATLATPAPLAVREIAQAEQPPTLTAPAASRPGVALMIVGGALFIAGALVDDGDAGTVLMVAGAAIGAYGLYQYFR